MQPESKAGKATKAIFEVTLAGVPLKLKSGQDPEMVKKLVSFVDNKVELAAAGAGRGLRVERRAAGVRARLRRRLGQGDEPRPV